MTAVEPSAVMIAQRPPGAAPAIQAAAEALPFEDGAFDAAMAVLTLHHWTDWRAGIEELRRVARRVVVLLLGPELRGPAVDQRGLLPGADRRGRRALPQPRRPGGRAARAARVGGPDPRTTAATASTGPTGAVQRPTSIRWCAPGISTLAKRAPAELDGGPGPARGRHPHAAPGPSATPTCSSSTSSTSATGCWSAAKALLRPPLEPPQRARRPAPRAGGSSRPSSAAARRAPCAPSPTTRPGPGRR